MPVPRSFFLSVCLFPFAQSIHPRTPLHRDPGDRNLSASLFCVLPLLLCTSSATATERRQTTAIHEEERFGNSGCRWHTGRRETKPNDDCEQGMGFLVPYSCSLLLSFLPFLFVVRSCAFQQMQNNSLISLQGKRDLHTADRPVGTFITFLLYLPPSAWSCSFFGQPARPEKRGRRRTRKRKERKKERGEKRGRRGGTHGNEYVCGSYSIDH